VHFDRARYEQTVGRDPAAQEQEERESWILFQLETGRVPPDHLPVLADEERRREWEERKDQLLEQYLTPPLTPGRRPDAWWWRYEAQRPEYLSEVDYGSHDLELITREDHEREIEKFTWLAEHNHLAPIELELIEARGRAAAERIGTDHEQQAACSPDFGGDKLDAALADAVEAALRR
jgi:hypothetical protein